MPMTKRIVAASLSLSAALALLVAVDFYRSRQRTLQKATAGDLLAIDTALSAWASDHGGLLPDAPELFAPPHALPNQPLRTWHEPAAWPVHPRQRAFALQAFLSPGYMRSVPAIDGWGHPLLCSITPDRRHFTLLSLGRDGQPDPSHTSLWPWPDFDRDLIRADGSVVSGPTDTAW